MCACGCEAVIWCMDVGVKADRLKIVIIPVPSINYSLLVILMCVVLFILQRIVITSIILSNNVLPVCCCALLNVDSFIHGHFLFSSFFYLFYLIKFYLAILFFCSLCSFKWNKEVLGLTWQIKRRTTCKPNGKGTTKPPQKAVCVCLLQINNGDNRRLSLNRPLPLKSSRMRNGMAYSICRK